MTLESKSTSSTKKKKSNNFDIYLASSSPRRAEILKNLKLTLKFLNVISMSLTLLMKVLRISLSKIPSKNVLLLMQLDKKEVAQ